MELQCFSKTKKLYHGSHYGINGTIKLKSRDATDFGVGFYMGNFPKQAQSLICEDEEGVFYEVIFDLDNLSIYDFGSDYILWALYIGHNRKHINIQKYKELVKIINDINKYDVIIGKIADDQIADVFTDFNKGLITSSALIECIRYLNLGDQYVCKTELACNNVSILNQSDLTNSQKSLLRRERNTSLSGISYKVKEIIDKNRRSGMYVDELLAKYR